jgi:aminoglycoside phosphotransferase (APT) family kinase protein
VEGALARDLAAYLTARQGHPVPVTGLARLPGGASRETWAFDAELDGRTLPLVLRRDPPGRPTARDCGHELGLLRAAAAAGVPVPAARWGESGPEHLGSPFVVMDRLEGETIPRRVLRAAATADRARLVAQCGAALAAVHRVPLAGLPALGEPVPPSGLVDGQRETLDGLGEPHPVFELALRWLWERAPRGRAPALVHGDFRLGNLIVGPDGLRAVLDWELAHAGDPAEDLGWFCVRAWRFGADARPAGGLGAREELLAAYRAAGGASVELADLRFWEVYGTLRWGIMCALQASVHLSGAVRSVELAAIGRRACEMEWALLELIG